MKKIAVTKEVIAVTVKKDLGMNQITLEICIPFKDRMFRKI